jgi:predicted dehydrogenase
LSVEQLHVPEGDALASEIAAFLQAVRARQTPPVTGWDGLRALEVAHVVRESVETEVRAAKVFTRE